WPSEHDRRGADVAAFVDLLGAARRTVALSTFTLDDETMVEPSSLVDEIDRAGLSAVAIDSERKPIALSITADLQTLGWKELRAGRTAGADQRFHGQAGAAALRPWSVSAIETYLACPFKFFAQHVLKLDEEPDDDEVMDPRKQGQFI